MRKFRDGQIRLPDLCCLRGFLRFEGPLAQSQRHLHDSRKGYSARGEYRLFYFE